MAKEGKQSYSPSWDCELKQHILDIHQVYKQYGYPQMRIALRDLGFFINHKKVYRLMRELGIQSVIPKKRRILKIRLSRVFDNVADRKFKDRHFNELLVTDITYLPVKNSFLYLSAVQDFFNNEVVALKMSKRNDFQLVLDTLEELTNKRSVYRSIIHSDQGFQYTSHAYQRHIQQLGMIGSHSRKAIVMKIHVSNLSFHI